MEEARTAPDVRIRANAKQTAKGDWYFDASVDDAVSTENDVVTILSKVVADMATEWERVLAAIEHPTV